MPSAAVKLPSLPPPPADMKVLAIIGEAQEVAYNRYFPPDTQAAIFWLRNRRRKQ
jgi:hypothetical protein